MTVIVTPLDDFSFRFAVACAIDRIAASVGLRPDELTPSPSLAQRLETELRAQQARVSATDGDTLLVARPD